MNTKHIHFSKLDILEARLAQLTKAELAFNIKVRQQINGVYHPQELRHYYPIPSDADDLRSRYYRHH